MLARKAGRVSREMRRDAGTTYRFITSSETNSEDAAPSKP
jgi:hypothetical protein